MWLGRISVRNAVLINVVMAALLVVGTYSFIAVPREAFPEINFNWAFITTVYPGASPEEVEQLVTKPLEEAIDDVNKIDMITSSSQEGFSFISAKFEQNLSQDEFDKRFNELQAKVNGVRTPDGAEETDVEKLDQQSWTPVISVVVSGSLPEARLKAIAENLKDLISQNNEVSRVVEAGIRDRQVWVEVDPDRLDRLNVTLPEVASALTMKNLNVPGGTVRGGRNEYILRTLGQFKSVTEIESVVIRTYPNGHQVKIGDVAEVRDTFEEADILSRLNGRPSLTLNVTKKSGASTLDVVRETRKTVERYRAEQLPEGGQIDLINDSSVYIHDSLNVLQSNAMFGFIMVGAVLWLFLGWRSALMVVVGMPVTYAIAFAVMLATGQSLNGTSLFGLVLVSGMIVDHAIVMVENSYRHLLMGKPARQAVIDGIGEVIAPVTSAMLTTVAAFLPLMLMPGIVGAYMRIIPLVVVIALVASMFEAFVILPSHVAEWSGSQMKLKEGGPWFRGLRTRYVKALAWMARRRYAVIGSFLVLLVASAGLIPLVGVNMFASETLPMIYVDIWMPPGTELNETDRVAQQVEQIAMTLPDEELEAVVTTSGYMVQDNGNVGGTHVGQIVVDLTEQKHRRRTVEQIIDDLRLRTAAVAGFDRIAFRKLEGGPPTGKAVEVKVKGKRFEDLQKIADELKAELASMPGVFDISDNFELGKEEIRVTPNEERARLHGLSVAQIAGIVRAAVNGETATTFRDGDEDIAVVVRYAGGKDFSVERIEAMKLLTPYGSLIPLREVADLTIQRGYADIQRFEVERTITVSADVNPKVNSAVRVNQAVVGKFNELTSRFPGYALDFRGQFQEFNTAFNSLFQLFALGNFLIFIILVAQFRSISQPFIILFTVPFAFIGAMVGLVLSKTPFSISTLYGVVALAGIVVNDSIVLIDFINKRRRQGGSKWRAILEGGKLRLRPIILTTVTTVAGLVPMALGIGGKSEAWMPLATTIVWGLSTASFLTLFVIPSLYAIFDDMAFLRRRRERTEARLAETERKRSPRRLAPELAD